MEKFKDPAKPLAGEAGLNDAVAKGLIRVATREDMDEYLAARNKAGRLTEEAAFRAKQVDLTQGWEMVSLAVGGILPGVSAR